MGRAGRNRPPHLRHGREDEGPVRRRRGGTTTTSACLRYIAKLHHQPGRSPTACSHETGSIEVGGARRHRASARSTSGAKPQTGPPGGRASRRTGSSANPNAATDDLRTPGPRPLLGAHGATPAEISVAFVAQGLALDQEHDTAPTRRRRRRRARHPRHRPGRPRPELPVPAQVDVDAGTPAWSTLDGDPLRSEPGRVPGLAQPPLLPAMRPALLRSPGPPPMAYIACRRMGSAQRTWVAWPGPTRVTFDRRRGAGGARAAWAAVARDGRPFQPALTVHGPGQDDYGAPGAAQPRRRAPPVAERDAGRRLDAGQGPDLRDRTAGRAAPPWTGVFNGWGAQDWARPGGTTPRSPAVRRRTSPARPAMSSPLVNEGGAIHVDAEGTVLLTDTVKLDSGPQSRAGARERVEAEVHANLGTTQGDLAAPRPDRRLRQVRHQRARRHRRRLRAAGHRRRAQPARPPPPRPRALRGDLEILRGQSDAKGRRLEVVEVPPTVLKDEEGDWVDYRASTTPRVQRRRRPVRLRRPARRTRGGHLPLACSPSGR